MSGYWADLRGGPVGGGYLCRCWGWLDPATVIVAIDLARRSRVWISNGAGLLADPMSLSVSREGISQLELALNKHASRCARDRDRGDGQLHRPWVTELERLHPGSVRLFAPSETKSARTQLGSGRFKTDDRDCAALTYMARQGGGRRYGHESSVEALRARSASTRVGGRPQGRSAAVARPAQCTLSRIVSALGSWSILAVETPTGLAVLACAAAFQDGHRNYDR